MSLNILSQWRAGYNASLYYRLHLPMQMMLKHKLASPILALPEAQFTNDELADAYEAADIAWQYQPVDPQFQNILEHSLRMPSRWTSETDWEPPFSMVIDTDDDLFNIMPTNRTPFRDMGTRVDGRDLEPGAVISVENDEGKAVELWRDGVAGFDVGRNLQRMAQYRTNLGLAAMVTCSTPRSAAYVNREVPNANTFVMPNCFNFEEYPEVELADKGKQVRLLWQGSNTHLEDIAPYRYSIAKILKANPHVELVMWGEPYHWPEWPKEQLKLLGWNDYREFKLRLSMMNHDINLCFLQDYEFGNARSAIKFGESSAIWKPAATLASRVGAFADECIDGETALLFSGNEEFETKLQGLIDDTTLRKTLASNAKDWIRTNRDPVVWTTKLVEAFEGIRRVKKLASKEPPKPKETNAESVSAE